MLIFNEAVLDKFITEQNAKEVDMLRTAFGACSRVETQLNQLFSESTALPLAGVLKYPGAREMLEEYFIQTILFAVAAYGAYRALGEKPNAKQLGLKTLALMQHPMLTTGRVCVAYTGLIQRLMREAGPETLHPSRLSKEQLEAGTAQAYTLAHKDTFCVFGDLFDLAHHEPYVELVKNLKELIRGFCG